MSLALRAGTLNEPKEVKGVADTTGELLKEGTTSLSATALAESAARMGSTLNVGSGADETGVRHGRAVRIRTGCGEAAGGRAAASVAAGIGTGAVENKSAATDCGGQIATGANRAGTLSKADVWRPSVRRNSADGRDRQQNDDRGRQEILRGELWRGAGASLRCGKVRHGGGEESD